MKKFDTNARESACSECLPVAKNKLSYASMVLVSKSLINEFDKFSGLPLKYHNLVGLGYPVNS